MSWANNRLSRWRIFSQESNAEQTFALWCLLPLAITKYIHGSDFGYYLHIGDFRNRHGYRFDCCKPAKKLTNVFLLKISQEYVIKLQYSNDERLRTSPCLCNNQIRNRSVFSIKIPAKSLKFSSRMRIWLLGNLKGAWRCPIFDYCIFLSCSYGQLLNKKCADRLLNRFAINKCHPPADSGNL